MLLMKLIIQDYRKEAINLKHKDANSNDERNRRINSNNL